MSWIEVGGTDVHYVEAGSGQPLVFLHGFGSCAEAWYQQFAVFSSRFRVIAYDSVNHGHSSNSPRGEPEPDRADELEGFLDALGIDRPILAGNSMGALTILRWAVRSPDRALALVPSGMGVLPAGAAGEPPEPARRMFEPVADELVFIPGERGFTPGFRERSPAAYERYVRLRSTATRIEAARHPRQPAMSRPTREELAGRVGAIRSPMQIVVGEVDWLADAARHLHELVGGSRLAVVPGGPHNVYYEAAEPYNRVAGEFLVGVAAAPAR
ncbi:MAG TPA: alpha/beta hydrolase [Candidatus Dormibacteraeota bacterium]|nr:alpha/beta hydrolase [Candidatus Dormibacteraeota bacterium]